MIKFLKSHLLLLVLGLFLCTASQAQTLAPFVSNITPQALACDGKGNLYVNLSGQNSIIGFKTDGSSFVLPSGAQGLNNPVGLACDTSGNLYVANATDGANTSNGPTVGSPATFIKISTNGSVSTVASISSMNNVSALAIDAFGNLYETNETYGNGADQVTKISPTGQLINLCNNDYYGQPNTVTCDALGNVYFHDGLSTLYEITPSGQVSSFKDIKDLTALTADAYGNIYLGYTTSTETINQAIYNSLDYSTQQNFNTYIQYGYDAVFVAGAMGLDPNLVTTTTTGYVSRISSNGYTY